MCVCVCENVRTIHVFPGLFTTLGFLYHLLEKTLCNEYRSLILPICQAPKCGDEGSKGAITSCRVVYFTYYFFYINFYIDSVFLFLAIFVPLPDCSRRANKIVFLLSPKARTPFPPHSKCEISFSLSYLFLPYPFSFSVELHSGSHFSKFIFFKGSVSDYICEMPIDSRIFMDPPQSCRWTNISKDADPVDRTSLLGDDGGRSCAHAYGSNGSILSNHSTHYRQDSLQHNCKGICNDDDADVIILDEDISVFETKNTRDDGEEECISRKAARTSPFAGPAAIARQGCMQKKKTMTAKFKLKYRAKGKLKYLYSSEEKERE